MVLKDTNLGRLILDNISEEKTAESKPVKKVCMKDVKRISDGLAKVAGLPYKEEAYKSVQEIMKIASGCIGELVNSLESLESRNFGLEKAAEVRVLIDDMIKSGSVHEDNAEEKVTELMEKDSGQLEVIKEAMNMLKNGKEGNVFFELEKEASVSGQKLGMFDNVINSD